MGYQTTGLPDLPKADKQEIEIKDLEDIRISRELLEKWVDEIYFEETVKECYVRLNLGVNKETNTNCYRICEVSNVVDYPVAYKLGNKKINKALQLKYASRQQVFKMSYISNSKFEPNEFADWKRHNSTKGELPSLKKLQKKKEDIKKASSYIVLH